MKEQNPEESEAGAIAPSQPLPHVQLTAQLPALPRRRGEHLRLYPFMKQTFRENQDGGVGGHTVPPRTTRTDGKSNGKEVRHQVNKK